jgi:hypothetical protein
MRRMLWIGCVLLASGCVVREYRPPPPPPVVYREPPPPPPPAPIVQPEVEVAIDVEPPVDQPVAVAIPWAPPPMRWDPPPPAPYGEVVWVGGHWTWWNGEWVWARGHWARPPRVGYVYAEPYYEHRGDVVVFVAGFWRPTYRVFMPPPPTAYIQVVEVRVVHVGYARPMGPHGVFVPPPPGSQPGVIIPAPVGTPPAVVLSAPPVVRPGMVVRPVATGGVVEVVAPAGVTREGRPVNARARSWRATPRRSTRSSSRRRRPCAARPPRRFVGRTPPSTPGPVQGWNGQTGVVAQPDLLPVRPGGGGPASPAPGAQPLVQPTLKPEAMGGQRGNPRAWPEAADPGGRPGQPRRDDLPVRGRLDGGPLDDQPAGRLAALDHGRRPHTRAGQRGEDRCLAGLQRQRDRRPASAPTTHLVRRIGARGRRAGAKCG